MLSLKRKNLGFTLIELLIVVVVISILAGIGLTALGRAQRSARDGDRRSDIETIRGALEEFYADNNRYPSTGIGPMTSALEGGGHIGDVPDDPDPTKNYSYEQLASGQAYCIAADLEAPKPDDPAGTCNGTTFDYVKRQND